MDAPVSGAAPVPPVPGALVIDARALHASGIGRYLRELLTHWLAEPPFSRLVLLGDAAALHGALDLHHAAVPVAIVPHAGAFYGVGSQRSWLRARRDARVRQARAAFFPHWDAPLLGMPGRSVVTVHDLTHFRVPEAFSRSKRLVAAGVLRRVVARASRLVCVSASTARDVVADYPHAAVRVRTVHNGVAERFRGPAPAPPLAGPYLLAVGNQKPHKNLAAAVGVLARLRAAGHHELRLVVAGREFAAADAVLVAARAAGIAEHVVSLGEVDDATLHGAYGGCAALVYPSRYEGFGLPVLEAMAAGAPVVASSAPAVAEVVGDAAPTFAPDDVAGMAAAVEALLRDPGARGDAVARGRSRAREFAWHRTARETTRVLHEAAGEVAPATRGPVGDGGVAPADPVILPA